jgi:hypothetical protein
MAVDTATDIQEAGTAKADLHYIMVYTYVSFRGKTNYYSQNLKDLHLIASTNIFKNGLFAAGSFYKVRMQKMPCKRRT